MIAPHSPSKPWGSIDGELITGATSALAWAFAGVATVLGLRRTAGRAKNSP